MDNNEQQRRERIDYVTSLSVAHTKDEFGADRWFVEDTHGDWIEGPFGSRDLAWGHIAKVQATVIV